MWGIYEKHQVRKIISKAPREVVVRYEAWKRIIELKGPKGLREVKGFYDEALKGNWRPFRSSRLGLKWRVIYFVKRRVFVIEIMFIDANENK